MAQLHTNGRNTQVGQASPNPSYKENINSVTGNQDEVVKDENNNTIATYQLSLGEYKFNGIGNYKDKLVTDRSTGKWYKYNAITEYQMTGEENIVMQNNNTRFGFTVENAINVSSEASNVLGLCNYFKGVSFSARNSSVNSLYLVSNGQTGQNGIYFNTGTLFANTNAFKTWLQTYKPILNYVLATPTLTEITDTTLINQLENWYNAKSFNGTVLIQGNGNLPMIIKVRALKGE